MGQRAVPGRCVVLERESLPRIRQVVESAVIHGLADLPFDQRLSHPLARRFGGVGALGIPFETHGPSVAQGADRQPVAERG